MAVWKEEMERLLQVPSLSLLKLLQLLELDLGNSFQALQFVVMSDL